jgi:hypothetical protein
MGLGYGCELAAALFSVYWQARDEFSGGSLSRASQAPACHDLAESIVENEDLQCNDEMTDEILGSNLCAWLCRGVVCSCSSLLQMRLNFSEQQPLRRLVLGFYSGLGWAMGMLRTRARCR